MSYDKSVEEIKAIFRSFGYNGILGIESEIKLNKDLSDFLKRFEEEYFNMGDLNEID